MNKIMGPVEFPLLELLNSTSAGDIGFSVCGGVFLGFFSVVVDFFFSVQNTFPSLFC